MKLVKSCFKTEVIKSTSLYYVLKEFAICSYAKKSQVHDKIAAVTYYVNFT